MLYIILKSDEVYFILYHVKCEALFSTLLCPDLYFFSYLKSYLVINFVLDYELFSVSRTLREDFSVGLGGMQSF